MDLLACGPTVLLVHTEAQTFGAALRVTLGLPPEATLEACANAVQELVARSRCVVRQRGCGAVHACM